MCVCSIVDEEEDAFRPPKRSAEPANEEDDLVPPAKRARDISCPVLSMQHPVSELVQRYPQATFEFKSELCVCVCVIKVISRYQFTSYTCLLLLLLLFVVVVCCCLL